MKTYKLTTLLVLAMGIWNFCLADSSPSPADGEKALRQQIDSDSQRQIKLVSFKKTDGLMSVSDGVQNYELDYGAEIEFQANGTWFKGMQGVSFGFSAQQASQGSWAAFANQNVNGGITVHSSDRAKLSGNIQFIKKESGWTIVSGDCRVVSGPTSTAMPATSQPTTASQTPSAPLLSSQTWTVKPEAWNFTIVKEIYLESSMAAPVFSHDCNKIAYMNGNLLEIKTLTEAKPDFSQDVGGQILLCCWSPDDKRILCVMSDMSIKVFDIQAGKVITLPLQFNLYGIDRIFWESENIVYFGNSNNFYTQLNLDTLKFGGSIQNFTITDEMNKIGEFENPGITLKNDMKYNAYGVFASSRAKEYSKLLVPGEPNTTYIWPSNLKCILKGIGGIYTSILITGITNPSTTEFDIKEFNNVESDSGKEMLSDLSHGRSLTADVFTPETNPLNRKIIGSAGKYKGSAKIHLQGNQIHASIIFEREPSVVGDVVGNLQSIDTGLGVGSYDTAIWGALETETEAESQAATESNAVANPPENNSITMPAALQEILTKAQAGDAKAQYELGVAYANGKGTDTNYVEAVKWFLQAADQGNAPAQRDLGLQYQFGRGVDKDYVQAVTWYRKAADQGYARAQVNLGLMYENGWSVDKNLVEARNWFQKAANQGNVFAKNELQKLNPLNQLLHGIVH